MTPQEQQLLQGLTDRINQTTLTDKDPEAEQFIDQSLARNPDALYILAQTVLVQQYALDSARKQLDQAKQDLDQTRQQLQQAQQQPVKHSSFLGSLLGTDDRPAPPPYAPVQTYAPPPPVAYAQPVPYGYGAPQFGSPMGSPMGGGGGFLRSAMTTAAGVAAGAIAFEGIESLMHGFGEHAGYGPGYGGGFEGMGGGFNQQPREEIINNNYYGDATPEHHGGDLTDRFAAAGDQPSPDIEDRRDDNSQSFANPASDDDTTDDSANFDDSSNVDDSSSFDDGGGSDDSGF